MTYNVFYCPDSHDPPEYGSIVSHAHIIPLFYTYIRVSASSSGRARLLRYLEECKIALLHCIELVYIYNIPSLIESRSVQTNMCLYKPDNLPSLSLGFYEVPTILSEEVLKCHILYINTSA